MDAALQIQKSLIELVGPKYYIKVDYPQNPLHGDYSTNIAMIVFESVKSEFKTPFDFAEELVTRLNKEDKLKKVFSKIETVPPGFINFWLKDEFLIENLKTITDRKDKYGKGERIKNLASAKASAGKQKIMLEFADPNPFKEFHIGHLRNISLGESYARLMEFQGASVWRVNYQGDVGMHVAKALYGLLQISNLKYQISNLEKKPISERSRFLGEAYAMGAKAYEEENGKAKKEIQDLNIKIYQNDPSIREIWEKGRKWSLDHFEEIYKRVGTKYKRYYFESQMAPLGREVVLAHLRGGMFERHEGAVVFRGSHTRVFITRQNHATYEAKDLALAKIKSEDFSYDRSIIITANEQEQYFKVVLQAMAKVFPDLAQKTIHQSFGFVKLKEGKMSSRSGNIVAGEWLLDEAKKRIKEQFADMDEKTLEMVAVGAVKYSMLKFSRTSDILFSFEESISISGNSGPYLQYTYARTNSVLAKSQISNLKSQINSKIKNSKLEKEETLLLRLLIHFPEVVEEAEENFAPNLLCNYLFELSQKFNNFYQKHKIIGSKNEDFRLSLTSAVGQILKTGLYLLGIESPNKM